MVPEIAPVLLMIPQLGPMELVLIMVIVLIVFGAGKLRDIGGSLGQGIREFKKAVNDDPETPAMSAGAAQPAPAATMPTAAQAAPVATATAAASGAYCAKCGTQATTDSRFCPKCGSALPSVAA